MHDLAAKIKQIIEEGTNAPDGDGVRLYKNPLNDTLNRILITVNRALEENTDPVLAEQRAIVEELIHYGDISPESQKDGFYAASHRVRDRIDRAKERTNG